MDELFITIPFTAKNDISSGLYFSKRKETVSKSYIEGQLFWYIVFFTVA